MRTSLWSYLGKRRSPRGAQSGAALQLGFLGMTGTTLYAFAYIACLGALPVTAARSARPGADDTVCPLSTPDDAVLASALAVRARRISLARRRPFAKVIDDLVAGSPDTRSAVGQFRYVVYQASSLSMHRT